MDILFIKLDDRKIKKQVVNECRLFLFSYGACRFKMLDEPNREILLQSRAEYNISVPGTMEEDDIIVLSTNNFSRRQS